MLPFVRLAFCNFFPMLICMLAGIATAAEGQSSSTPPPVSGRPLSIDAILPADVLARVELVQRELELIRFEMGQPKARASELAVADVAPRQALYQAMTLFRNANQLYLEVTGDSGNELTMDSREYARPFHVWKIVDAAYARLVEVERRLGVSGRLREEPKDVSTTPAEVFVAIADANVQLQLLLRNRITTNELFQQGVLATEYATSLLAHISGSTSLHEAPTLERGKRPIDLYNLLVGCYARLYAVTTKSGLAALKLEVAKPEQGILDPAQIRPSEVYDVATLVLSELAYLHGQLDNAETPVPIQVPEFKLSSHVFQRGRLLLWQLSELEELVAADPNWHRKSG